MSQSGPIKRGFILAGLIAAGIVSASLAVWFLVPHEPSYKGTGLSAWLSDFEHDRPEKRGMAADAVRHIGPEAVPYLVKRLGYGSRPKSDSRLLPWKRQLLVWLSNHSSIKISPGRPANPRLQALAGLDALGTAAKDTLPELEKLLEANPPDPHALYVVARIGEAGVPLLTKSLTNSVSTEAKLLRMQARICLDMMKSHSEVLYPKVDLGPDCSDFSLRICQFKMLTMQAAFLEYRQQHPEMNLPPSAFELPPVLTHG